jgi:transglutaminase-like putative cysteine protease
VSGSFIYHKSYLHQGEFLIGGDTYVEKNQIKMVDLDGKEEILNIPNGTILPNTHLFTYLKNDFAENELESKKYSLFDLRTRLVNEIEYIKVGEESIELAGKEYEAVVLSESDPRTGLYNKIWINKADGIRLKMESSNKINMYLTDPSVTKKIKTGNWDTSFFIKTNEKINDFRAISYIKTRVKLEAIPNPAMEDLNYTGQKFTGSINENSIDGEFIISHNKYNGKSSPGFPFDKTKYDISNDYLDSNNNIESDDPELIDLAQKITKESVNLWEASCRISNWVADNIEGSILDGSAKETYEQKSGLCGAQSKLMAALCRAAGIPARVVWGCMYTQEYDGSFGHHAWNEVFMGEAGWIAVDVSTHEPDFIDSGHIRLGVLKTPQTIINYEEIDILDYKLFPE